MKISECIGQQFGYWTILREDTEREEKDNRKIKYCICRCKCGTVKSVNFNNVTRGLSKSCGCYKQETTRSRSRKHGKTGTRLYQTWINMRRRCYEKTNKRYKNYGGRGITVCDEWQGEKGFVKFSEWAMRTGYDETAKYGTCTLDRIDYNGNYCPENCRWVTIQEQNVNRTNNVYVTYAGITMTLKEWADYFEEDQSLFHGRYENGWDKKRIIEQPKRGCDEKWQQKLNRLHSLTA